MAGRMILLALGLSLLAGCGRRDQPTVRQVSMRSENEQSATTAPNPPQVPEASCPGRPGPHRTHPRPDARRHSKPVRAADAKAADENRPKSGETSPPKDAAAADAKTPGKSEAKTPTENPSEIGVPIVWKKIAKSPAKAGAKPRPKAAPRSDFDPESRDVRIGGVCLVAPKTWTRTRPPLSFILAQFSLPRAEGDPADAHLTVAAAGEDNPRSVRRLREQLNRTPEEGSIEHLRFGSNEVVLIDSPGDDRDPDDPIPLPEGEGRSRSLNAAVFAGGKLYFVNCTGPEKTVGARADEFRAFLQTMKAVE